MKLKRVLWLAILLLGLVIAPAGVAVADPADDPDAPGSTDTGSGPSDSDPATGTPGNDPGSGQDAPPPPPGVSTPRVMLKAFSTDPATLVAGQDFTVNFTLHNTSQRTYVRNVKVTLIAEEGAFLPANGSSALYLPQINQGDVETGTMTFRSLPSLEEKPYQFTLNLEYEDRENNPFSSTETVSVMVTQKARADASAPQLVPSPLTVGQDASLTFSVHNQGKTKLYNVKAAIAEGQPLTGAEVFVGTIEPGSSGAVDLTVQAEAEESGPATINITYEDVNGKPTTITREVEVTVEPPLEDTPAQMQDYPEEQPGAGLGVLMLLMIVGGLALVGLAIGLLVRRSRRRRAEQEELESLALLEGEPLVPTDEH
ncbi:COG1361 S-layer family protein [Enemella sp. A6]|uniref:COG1361 S-layer family protein n=1 Tax=Enemella sp. A6 TaxID=3440152 RepID=UPI003EBFF6C4